MLRLAPHKQRRGDHDNGGQYAQGNPRSLPSIPGDEQLHDWDQKRYPYGCAKIGYAQGPATLPHEPLGDGCARNQVADAYQGHRAYDPV